MTKEELVNTLADSCCSKGEASEYLDKLLSVISDTLASGGEVRLPGFGVFSVSQRKARAGRNPRTGATIQIPASKAPKFKAGKPLKDAVNR